MASVDRAPEPILVPCAGAGCRPCASVLDAGMCSMCGVWYVTQPDGKVPPHQRQDIIAMIARGDFGR